jgi:hypothetical protein
VQLAHLEGQRAQPEPLVKGQLELRDYLALTELQVLQDCVELQVAQEFKVSKARLDNKVLLVLAQLVLPEPRGSKARLGRKVLLEWLALAELQD